MSAPIDPSLDRLYCHYNGWLQGILSRRLGCTETAADLTQDTFLRLLARGQNVEEIQQPRAYLSKIALGLVANHWRRKDIEQAYLQALSQQDEHFVPSPESQHIVIETLYRIDAMLRELPTKVRQAFLMSRLDGVRYADIAITLGVSERMVKKYMAQAMLHCLRTIEER